MKVAILLVALATILAVQHVSAKVIFNTNRPPPMVTRNAGAKAPIMNQIRMKVDNFNPADTRTWYMRYYTNDQHFVNQGPRHGPIFIYLGGEWAIDAGSLQGGQIYDMAEEHGGYMIYTEHRYYGKSWPTTNLSTANLKYLSIEQALADVAALIRQFKSTPTFSKSKVVVIGGSYSATMATWSRILYPDLIDAAYASSAPLLALDDFKQYFEVVGKNIDLESPQCWNVINEATFEMSKLYDTPAGRETLGSLLNSCEPLITGFPYKDQMFNQIANVFAGLVQYAKPGQIKAACNRLLGKPGTPTQKLAAYVREENDDGCLGNYEDLIYWYSNTELNPNRIYRQWFYQTCTEFGFFQSGNSNQQPFGRNWFSTLSHKMCEDVFGPEFSKNNILKRIDATNAKYGGLRPAVTKVISIHGSVDPWHAIGLLNSANNEAPAILVQGTAHCDDLSSISWTDSVAMRNAKQAARDYISKWIA